MNLPFNGLETKIATMCLLRENGKTVMIHRDKDPEHFMHGMWGFPGGKFNSEDEGIPEKCIRREYGEEGGVELINLQYRGVVFFDNKHRNFQGKPAKFNFLVYVFEAYNHGGELNSSCNEGSIHWVEDGEIRKLKMEKGDQYILDLLEKKIPLNHRIILSDNDAKIEPIS
ncbi:MAG: NUDIX domain-containing protein [archaeon]